MLQVIKEQGGKVDLNPLCILRLRHGPGQKTLTLWIFNPTQRKCSSFLQRTRKSHCNVHARSRIRSHDTRSKRVVMDLPDIIDDGIANRAADARARGQPSLHSNRRQSNKSTQDTPYRHSIPFYTWLHRRWHNHRAILSHQTNACRHHAEDLYTPTFERLRNKIIGDVLIFLKEDLLVTLAYGKSLYHNW